MSPQDTLIPNPRSFMSETAQRASHSAISYLMQQGVENPDCIALAAGFVDQSTLPVELVRDATNAVMSDVELGRGALQYGTTPGPSSLRNVYRRFLTQLEGNDETFANVDDSQFLLSTGSQQILSLVARTIFNPGDICLVAAPTYFVMLALLESVGVEAIPVETDSDGMRPDALEQVLQQLEDDGRRDRVKLIYVVSYYDNPSGWALSEERRQPIVDIAERLTAERPECPVFVLEDAAYREIRLSGPVLPSMWSMDESRQRVIYTQTFSKSFSPGVRVALSVLPREIAAAVNDLKANDDFGSPHLSQQIIAWTLRNGGYAEHVDLVREGYRVKRDAMLAACDRYFSDMEGVDWVRPDGGLYVWMTLPEHLDSGFDSELFHRATKVEKVMYVPGELAYPANWKERPRHQMRLSFGLATPANLEEGIRRLANAVRHCLK